LPECLGDVINAAHTALESGLHTLIFCCTSAASIGSAHHPTEEIAMTSLIRLSGIPTVRWNPVGFRTHTRPEVTGIDRALHSLATEIFGNASESTAELRADVRETATAYLVQFDVPGVSKADITVDVDEKTVRVEASFKRDAVEGETTLLSERANTALTRQLRLPHAVDVAKKERGNAKTFGD
jgi:HSP20 family protein